MSDTADITGTVWAVFAHRFALETPAGRILADLGPEGAEAVTLRTGDRVTIRGEQKPSEIKVSHLVTPDGAGHAIARRKKPHEGEPVDLTTALSTIARDGYAVAGEAKRKPEHWEIPARRDGRPFRLHVRLDGTIRKAEPDPPVGLAPDAVTSGSVTRV